MVDRPTSPGNRAAHPARAAWPNETPSLPWPGKPYGRCGPARRPGATGLSAFLTLVTTGVIIKGRDTTAGLSTSWRVLVTVLIGGGLALAVAGLWRVLAAQAGTRYRLSTRRDISRTYGTVEAYQIAVADRAIDDLDVGRRLVIAALALLLIGVGVTWWAPLAPIDPPAYLKVTYHNTSACGVLRSADNGQIRLAVTGNHDAIIIPLTQIINLTVVATCE